MIEGDQKKVAIRLAPIQGFANMPGDESTPFGMMVNIKAVVNQRTSR